MNVHVHVPSVRARVAGFKRIQFRYRQGKKAVQLKLSLPIADVA
jgi:hypothetical protein